MTTAAGPPVLVDVDGEAAVTTIRLNRPENRNALTVELKVALRDALEAVADDPSVRAVVLASSGKAFSVGQDLREHAEALRSGEDGAIGADALSTVPEHYNRIAAALGTMRKPVVAAINGTAVGAGLGFVLACDLRVAAPGVKFATAFAGIGFGGDSGLSGTLAHCVGASRATELLMLGETFTAEQARDWGIVKEIADDPDEAALALARRLAERAHAGVPPRSRRRWRWGTVSSLREVLDHEAVAQARLGAHRGPPGRRRRVPRQAAAGLPGPRYRPAGPRHAAGRACRRRRCPVRPSRRSASGRPGARRVGRSRARSGRARDGGGLVLDALCSTRAGVPRSANRGLAPVQRVDRARSCRSRG